jgi:type II secretory pathway predicted ATPase ExeA
LALIQEEIIRLYRTGKKLVLIIDEAHFLKTDTLHVLRTLSNIEVPDKKLISVLLFGEDHFRKRLDHRTYRALLSRMFIRSTIAPLSTEEVEQYIKFRCLMAGGRGDLFTEDAHARIAERTNGVPREVNRLAHNAMLAAARKGLKQVTAEVVNTVAR